MGRLRLILFAWWLAFPGLPSARRIADVARQAKESDFEGQGSSCRTCTKLAGLSESMAISWGIFPPQPFPGYSMTPGRRSSIGARAMYLPCSVALVALMALPARGHQCINAPGQTECGRQVEKAMLEGFAKHPNKYVGLTIHSTYTDFQAYFHNAGMHDCPRPCFPQEEECVKFSSTYPGMAKVAWARDVGMAKHPEWYPELSSHSSDKQIARALYMHGIEGCPRVCEDDEVEGHFEPFYEGVQVAESESWMKGAQQAATEPPTTQAPTMPPTEPPTTQAPITTPVPTLPPSTQAPTPAPTTQAPTTQAPTPEPTTTAALTQAPTPAPTTTTEAPAPTPAPTTQLPAPAPLPSLPSIHQGSKKPACFKVGYSYTLLDCLNHVPSITGSREDCKAHCAGFKEASYFLFHVPLSLCHCPPASASPIELHEEERCRCPRLWDRAEIRQRHEQPHLGDRSCSGCGRNGHGRDSPRNAADVRRPTGGIGEVVGTHNRGVGSSGSLVPGRCQRPFRRAWPLLRAALTRPQRLS
eukprot:s751_g2.t1